MKNIAAFLDKFKKIIKDDRDLKIAISETIRETGVEIDPGSIDIRNNSVYIKANHVTKNEIFFQKQRLIDEIKNKTGRDIDGIF